VTSTQSVHPTPGTAREASATRSLRMSAAAVAARTASTLSKATGRGGSVIGGRVMMSLVPDAAARLAQGRRVTLVTGTNGKSTTTAMIAAALRTGYPTASNGDGANMPAGLITAMMRDGSAHVVLEVDEAWLPWAIEQTRPALVVLLNLSRDQLHRNPEPRRVAARWRDALRTVPTVVANADDPAVAWAAGVAEQTRWVSVGQVWEQDSALCPACGRLLDRADPDLRCECGQRRPQPEWTLADDELVAAAESTPLVTALPGKANAANAAMALAAAIVAGVPAGEASRAIGGVAEVAGRYAHLAYGGQSVRLLLAKNPAGWLAATRMLDGSTAPVVVAFNSDGVDGRDPSWLYDVSFEGLHGRHVVVCGRRGSDMTVRLRVDGIEPDGPYARLDEALQSMPDGPVDVVANYTAFVEARRTLRAARGELRDSGRGARHGR
jgi:lipid II isoglutaminyl synthase (glutamine-hydrolysing)